jgi:hypothetical protein
MMRARGDDPIGLAGPSSAGSSRAGAGQRVKKEEGDEEFAAVPEWKHLALPGAFNNLGGRARGQPLPVDGAPRDRGRRGRDQVSCFALLARCKARLMAARTRARTARSTLRKRWPTTTTTTRAKSTTSATPTRTSWPNA